MTLIQIISATKLSIRRNNLKRKKSYGISKFQKLYLSSLDYNRIVLFMNKPNKVSRHAGSQFEEKSASGKSQTKAQMQAKLIEIEIKEHMRYEIQNNRKLDFTTHIQSTNNDPKS